LASHLQKECEFVEIICNLGCGEKKMRKELKQHQEECNFRIQICPDCGISVQFRGFKKHQEECPLYPILCTQSCGGTYKRGNLTKHINEECPETKISCPFANYGCTIVVHRRILSSHMNSATQDHLLLLVAKISSLEKQNNELHAQLFAPPYWDGSSVNITSENIFSLSKSNLIANRNKNVGQNPTIRATKPLSFYMNSFKVKAIKSWISVGLSTLKFTLNNTDLLGYQNQQKNGFNIGYHYDGTISWNGINLKKDSFEDNDILTVEVHWMQNQIKFCCNKISHTVSVPDLDTIKDNLYPSISGSENRVASSTAELIGYYHADYQ